MKWRLVSGWSAAVILVLEFALFALILAPDDGGPNTFANFANIALVLKYSSIYGIAAIGASMIIGAGGIDLAPGAVIALASLNTLIRVRSVAIMTRTIFTITIVTASSLI